MPFSVPISLTISFPISVLIWVPIWRFLIGRRRTVEKKDHNYIQKDSALNNNTYNNLYDSEQYQRKFLGLKKAAKSIYPIQVQHSTNVIGDINTRMIVRLKATNTNEYKSNPALIHFSSAN